MLSQYPGPGAFHSRNAMQLPSARICRRDSPVSPGFRQYGEGRGPHRDTAAFTPAPRAQGETQDSSSEATARSTVAIRPPIARSG